MEAWRVPWTQSRDTRRIVRVAADVIRAVPRDAPGVKRVVYKSVDRTPHAARPKKNGDGIPRTANAAMGPMRGGLDGENPRTNAGQKQNSRACRPLRSRIYR